MSAAACDARPQARSTGIPHGQTMEHRGLIRCCWLEHSAVRDPAKPRKPRGPWVLANSSADRQPFIDCKLASVADTRPRKAARAEHRWPLKATLGRSSKAAHKRRFAMNHRQCLISEAILLTVEHRKEQGWASFQMGGGGVDGAPWLDPLPKRGSIEGSPKILPRLTPGLGGDPNLKFGKMKMGF